MTIFYYNKKEPKKALSMIVSATEFGTAIQELIDKGFVYLGYSAH